MTVAQSVAEILRDHVTLEVEGIDRMYLNAVVPMLQSERGIAWFFREYRGLCLRLVGADGSDDASLRGSRRGVSRDPRGSTW